MILLAISPHIHTHTHTAGANRAFENKFLVIEFLRAHDAVK